MVRGSVQGKTLGTALAEVMEQYEVLGTAQGEAPGMMARGKALGARPCCAEAGPGLARMDSDPPPKGGCTPAGTNETQKETSGAMVGWQAASVGAPTC